MAPEVREKTFFKFGLHSKFLWPETRIRVKFELSNVFSDRPNVFLTRFLAPTERLRAGRSGVFLKMSVKNYLGAKTYSEVAVDTYFSNDAAQWLLCPL